MNIAIITGHLTKDVELRRTTSGKAVASFTVAVNKFINGEQQADFINCVVWDKVAENMERYTSKGSHVAVSGSIQTRTYDNNQGQKVYVTEILARNVEFLSSKSERQQTQQVNQGYQNNAQNEDNDDFDIMDADIQF